MKRLRILLSVMLILSIFCSLTGCITFNHNYQISPDTVSSIQFYDLRENESSFEAFLETQSPVYTLPDNQVSDFLYDLSQLQFTDGIILLPVAMDPCFQYGKWTVRINYNDRSYRLISNTNYSAVFDENDEFVTSNHFGCDEKEWKKLLKDYVPWDIFRDYY